MIAHQYDLLQYSSCKNKQKATFVYSSVTSICYCIVPLYIRINQGGLPLIKVKISSHFKSDFDALESKVDLLNLLIKTNSFIGQP